MKYLPRVIDKELALRLEGIGAVLIEGPKWCGKTTTAMQQAKSVLKMQDPDMRDGYMATAHTKPSNLLQGAVPRLIDEWQDAPVLWDAVLTLVDDRGEPGQFILTGSNSVDDSQILHSGTGRISRLHMYPMSLYESQESSGSISILQLFNEPDYDIDGIASPMNVNDLIEAACRGGWPRTLTIRNRTERLRLATDYLDGVVESDIIRVDGVKRAPALARAIIRAYARNLSTLAKLSSLRKDIEAYNESCTDRTLSDYVDALKRLYIIQDIDAWSPAVRSASSIRRGTKRELVDPSIAVAALGLSPESLSVDLKTFGFIFECMAIRDLRAYTQWAHGEISFYHDRYDLEADIVLHLNDGRYALIECKLGSREIEEGAQHLLEIKRLVREYNQKEPQIQLREPDLLIILTGGPIAYTRQDGVKVIPLACLKD
jgi:predicted AAA+ superfamily ATPase